jgi:hypothetical protein
LRTETAAVLAYREGIAVRAKSAEWNPDFSPIKRGNQMNSIVYIVGLVVIVVAILSFFGLR